jgi:hypothetical protein
MVAPVVPKVIAPLTSTKKAPPCLTPLFDDALESSIVEDTIFVVEVAVPEVL